MATWKSFEQMESWKEAGRLVCEVYKATQQGPFERDFALRDQIRKSAISVPSNIAEGFERDSTKAFISFLCIAKGSCGELRTQLYLARKLGYIQAGRMRDLVAKAKRISRLIAGVITYLKKTHED
ncbi:MAG TPA: four helix bundle protein [Planctomycetota bacterium]|nr:four helix bundle protein [Planctomycetota bacterium]